MGGKRVWKIREKRRGKAWKSKEAKEKYWKEVDNYRVQMRKRRKKVREKRSRRRKL